MLGATICHMRTGQSLDARLIARRLADRRAELRLEQTEVAERAGLSRAYVSRLESGTVLNPKVFDLQRIANVLGIALPELMVPDPSAPKVTRYTADIEAAMREVEGLPPERAELILQAIRTTLELAKTVDPAPES